MRPVNRIGNRLASNPLPRPQGLVPVGIILDESPLFKPYAYTNGIMHYPNMRATPVSAARRHRKMDAAAFLRGPSA